MIPISNSMSLNKGDIVKLLYVAHPVIIESIEYCGYIGQHPECRFCWKVMVCGEDGVKYHAIPEEARALFYKFLEERETSE